MDNSISLLTVLLVDPDDVARGGVARLLDGNPELTVVGETAGNGAPLAHRLRPDLIVVDPQTAGGSDVPALDDLAAGSPESHICIYTASFEPSVVADLVLGRVDGYLLKRPRAGAELRNELAGLGRYGNLTIDRAILLDARRRLVGRVTVTAPEEMPVTSDRQRAILRRMAEGATHEEIAQSEGLGVRTVNREIENLYAKLNVSSPFALGVRAGQLGLI
jgi:two-component system, NarL family, response regulator DevR